MSYISACAAVMLFEPQQTKLLTFNGSSTRAFQAVLIRKIHADELVQYKNAVQEELDHEVKPLAWFAVVNVFPQLFKLAIRYLSVPGNSVDAERWHVMQTLAVRPKCLQLSPDRLTVTLSFVHSFIFICSKMST